MPNPYEILGLHQNASEDEVKKAYKLLARKHHPDKGGTAEKFKEINEAYTQIMKGQDPMQDFPEFAEIFKMFGLFSGLGGGGLGGLGLSNQFIRGPTIQASVNMSLEQIETGGNFVIKYRRRIPTGKMQSMVSQTPFGVMQVLSPEEIEKDYEADITIPPCHDQRQPLIFPGLAKAENLPPGDLHVSITLEKHPRFTRIGGSLDLQTELDITLKEALTGFKREILMLNNELPDIIEFEIIVNPYDSKRVKGSGMQLGSDSGDLVIKFKIKFPVILTEYTKELIRNLDDL